MGEGLRMPAAVWARSAEAWPGPGSRFQPLQGWDEGEVLAGG